MQQTARTLGEWRLLQQLDEGGTSNVWLAEHGTSHVPAAIKVLHHRATGSEAGLPFFVREVRAAASLRHPHIVRLLDFGVVPQVDMPPGVRPGSPYMVLEYAGGGSLDRNRDRLQTWEDICTTLLALLEAVAHAHARGILHRDIKPDNILWARDGDPGSLRLTDFGIAHITPLYNSTDEGRFTFWTGDRVMGTAAYMAPEQIDQDWIHYGPPTDLYSIGVLAWELLCGRLPFEGERFQDFAHMHRRMPLPPLDARMPVPAGVEAWIRRMTRKHPDDRFQRAADALQALQHCGADLQRAAAGQARSSEEGPQPGLDPSSTPAPPFATTRSPDSLLVALSADVSRPPDDLDPPTHWPRPDTLPGLDRSSLRAPLQRRRALRYPDDIPPIPRKVPFTPTEADDGLDRITSGRVHELNAPLPATLHDPCTDLWAGLNQVHTSGNPMAIVLHAGEGQPAQRICQWLTTAAEESGAAVLLKASRGTPGGLAWMFALWLRAFGYPEGYLVEQLTDRLDHLTRLGPADARILAAWIVRGSRPDATAEERRLSSRIRELALRAMRDVSRQRPLIIWFQDLIEVPEYAIFVCDLLLSPEGSTPILLLLAHSDPMDSTTLRECLPSEVWTSGRLHRLRTDPGEPAPPVVPVVDGIGLARACLHSGDIQTAFALASEILSHLAPNPDTHGHGGLAQDAWQAEKLMGEIAHRRGRFVEARQYHERALEHLQSLRRQDARGLHQLGELQLRLSRTQRLLGQLPEAIELAERARRALERARVWHLAGEAAFEQARIHLEARALSRAERLFGDARALAARAADPGLDAICRLGLARVQLLLSDHAEAGLVRALLERPQGASESCLNRARLAFARHVGRYGDPRHRSLLCEQVLQPLIDVLGPGAGQEARVLQLALHPGRSPDETLEALRELDDSFQQTGVARYMVADDLLWLARHRPEAPWREARRKAAALALAQFGALEDTQGMERCRAELDG
jgi:serine/threonine protein kinase/tetratricopeptide (TPR) repeat protein